jgi:transcriptional regulator with XRE-family HTH domain
MSLVDELREARLPGPRARRALRIAAGATQEQFGRELGIDRASVARWELGTREPRGQMRLRYAQLLRDLQSLAVE